MTPSAPFRPKVPSGSISRATRGASAHPIELTGAAALDVTELGPTGDLFHGGEPFDSAQRLWAEDFSMDCCQFLTGGSTLGLHTALALCCRPGDRVLIDQGCHRAVYNALALLDLDPVYLPRPWWEEGAADVHNFPGICGKALTEHPEIKTVLYYIAELLRIVV